jgi:hypothetical protein
VTNATELAQYMISEFDKNQDGKLNVDGENIYNTKFLYIFSYFKNSSTLLKEQMM